jgi:16S rRNA (guanine527-N7)-methyltransferase
MSAMSLRQTDILFRYFPSITSEQKNLFSEFAVQVIAWNRKINLISRKDTEQIFERHILHSLAIAKIISFRKDTMVLDMGTGGGFPGVPLAILFPDVKFILVDSVRKKINAVQEICLELGLKNVETINSRVENAEVKCDFVVSRAVSTLSEIYFLTKSMIRKESFNDLPNGILCLKGGDLTDEIKPFKLKVKVFGLRDFFEEDFFETKMLVYLPV